MGGVSMLGWPLLAVLLLALQGVPETEGERPTLVSLRQGDDMLIPAIPNAPVPNVTYFVTFSKKLFPGSKLPVTVVLCKPGLTAQVKVCLRNRKDQSTVYAYTSFHNVTSDGGPKTIHLEVPKHLKQPTSWRDRIDYVVRVTGKGDVTINETTAVTLQSKFYSVFVQTDKAKYKPGQTVKFRVLAMNPNLTVRHEPMDILVRDPKGNSVKFWRQATSYMDTGVVVSHIPTSSEAAVGDWKIDVTIMNQTETKEFTIEKYVLPKFEAILDLPEVVHTNDTSFKGHVLAKYTFGRPVTKASVTVEIKNNWSNRKGKEPVILKKGNVNEEGKFSLLLYRSDFLHLKKNQYDHSTKKNWTAEMLDHAQFKVAVNVTCLISNKTMQTEGKIKFTTEKAKLEFLTVSPSTFKPGLKYTAMAKVTNYDDSLFENYQDIMVTFNATIQMRTPINRTTTEMPLTTTSLMDKKMGNKTKPGIRPNQQWVRYNYHEEHLALVTKQLTANGYLAVEFDVPARGSTMKIEGSVLGVKKYKYNIGRAKSDSDNFLQIQAQADNPKAGHETSLVMKTTESVSRAMWQLYAKGTLVKEGVALPTNHHTLTAHFNVTANMAPSCRFLAFYFRQDGELVADSVSLKIDTSEVSGVEVDYSQKVVRPGQSVDMKVSSRPNSIVFLLSVDKSVKLLKSGNDITEELVDKELMQYNYGDGFVGIWPIFFRCWWPFPTLKTTAGGIFDEASVAIITDGHVHEEPEAATVFLMRGGAVADTAKSGKGDSSVEKVRKFFPETWLFDAVFIGSEGHKLMPQTAPDTITTWLTSAFSVHPQYGLSVIPKPAELTTFRSMFVTLHLPYSAVRGEDLCMKAFAYNYHDTPLYMHLTFERNEGIANIRIRRGKKKPSQYRAVGKITHRIGKVHPNQMRDTTFCFTPTKLGRIPLRVNLTARGVRGDGVERMLLVEPEGEARVLTTPVILDLKDQASFKETVNVTFPKTTVEGSEKITVAIAADLLGSVFDNIDDLLRMPYGCGEQNMLYFAPNVFLIDYLQNTDSYTPELAEKAENYMLVGYQKELKYKHSDGSYSAFGERPNRTDSGSMWLTAFVTKCLVQAMALDGDVICVERSLVLDAIEWMASHQNDNGSFTEPGKVFNKNMQGGSAKGEALTGYVLVALAETNRTGYHNMTQKEKMGMGHIIGKARTYLENQLMSLKDPYDVCLVTYALHLTHSPLKEDAFILLQSTAKTEPLTTHWERPSQRKQQRYWYYWQRKTDAINIEMTAYALLTYNLRNNLADALPIVRWLTQQRGPQGGFISTQDTVISLQALAQIAVDLYQPSFTPINVSVQWSTLAKQNQRHTVTLNDTTKLLLHKIHIPVRDNDIPRDITVEAMTLNGGQFSGMAVAEVLQDFTVQQEQAETKVYDLKVDVEGRRTQKPVLKLEAKRIDGEEGGMTVIEVLTPTGYSVDTEDEKHYQVPGTMMTQAGSDDTKFVLYYGELGSTAVTASLPLVPTGGMVVQAQERTVKIYEYYESGSDQKQSMQYDIDGAPLPDETVCDYNPDYDKCAFLTRSEGPQN